MPRPYPYKVKAFFMAAMMTAELFLAPASFASLIPNQSEEGQTMPSGQSSESFVQAQSTAESLIQSNNQTLQLSASFTAQTTSSETLNVYDEEGRLISQDTYTNGLLTQQRIYNPFTGAFTKRLVYVYDSLARLSRVDTYNPSSRLIQRDIYNVTTGKLTQVNFYSDLSRIDTFAGTGTRLIKRAIFNAEGALTETNYYYYDTTSRLARVDVKDSEGRLFRRDYYNAAAGLRYQSYYYNPASGAYIGRDIYYYDGARRLLRIQKYNSLGKVMEIDYYNVTTAKMALRQLYGSDGKLYERATFNALTGKLVYKQWYFYDSASGLTKLSRRADYDSSGRITRVTVYNNQGAVVSVFQPPLIQNAAAIQNGFSQNQAAHLTGLIVSHPDDTSFVYHEGIAAEWAKIYSNTQAYTYDQAAAAMTLLKSGDFTGAKKIFDFYYNEWQAAGNAFDGFWTVYNVDPAFAWKRYEWRKGAGENIWLALFCLQYESAAADPAEKAKALGLATAIGQWVSQGVPHTQGAIAMGQDNPSGNPNFGRIFSVENNVDYYALLRALSQHAGSAQDRNLFASELSNLRAWLKNEAYDTASGLFKRGGSLNGGTFIWDGLKSLDVNSWAISALGAETLATDFGIDIAAFAVRIATAFAVSDSGAFGQTIWKAKGFDFSDSVNAGLIGRTGVKWVEGTNQMIVVYRLLADYYRQMGRLGVDKMLYYESLADYFSSRNPENALVSAGGSELGYTLADAPGAQIYYGTSNWRVSSGRAVSSAAWVYFSLEWFNPFAWPLSG